MGIKTFQLDTEFMYLGGIRACEKCCVVRFDIKGDCPVCGWPEQLLVKPVFTDPGNQFHGCYRAERIISSKQVGEETDA